MWHTRVGPNSLAGVLLNRDAHHGHYTWIGLMVHASAQGKHEAALRIPCSVILVSRKPIGAFVKRALPLTLTMVLSQRDRSRLAC